MALTRIGGSAVNQVTTSTTIAISRTPATVGNMLIVSFLDIVTSAHTPTISDTAGNTWVLVCADTVESGSGSCAMWYCTGCNGTSSTTITVTTTSCAYRTVFVSEWSGQNRAAAFDQHSEATGTSAAPDSGAKNTNLADELIYGFAIGNSSLAAGAGFTAETNDGAGNVPEWKIVSSTGSYSCAWTQTSGAFAALMATFKQQQAVTGTVATHQQMLV